MFLPKRIQGHNYGSKLHLQNAGCIEGHNFSLPFLTVFMYYIYIILHWIFSPFLGINRCCDTDKLPFNPESSLRMSYCKKIRKITRTLRWIDPCVVRSGHLLSVPPTCVTSFLRLAEWLLVVTFPSEMSHDAQVRMLRSGINTSGTVIRKVNRISTSSIHWRGVRLTN